MTEGMYLTFQVLFRGHGYGCKGDVRAERGGWRNGQTWWCIRVDDVLTMVNEGRSGKSAVFIALSFAAASGSFPRSGLRLA